jgi:hypothetical protein
VFTPSYHRKQLPIDPARSRLGGRRSRGGGERSTRGSIKMRAIRFASPALRLVVVMGLVLGTLASTAAGAPTTVRARTASTCPKQTSRDAVGRIWSWRVVLRGKVSCSEAIRTNLAYIRAAREGRCRSRICSQVAFPGGWLCSSLSAAEEKELRNGLTSRCERRGASFWVYKVASHSGAPGTHRS